MEAHQNGDWRRKLRLDEVDMTAENQCDQVKKLMMLHDAAAESRHTQGAPVYNAVSAQAREALQAQVKSLIEAQTAEISRLQREVVGRNQRALDGDKATAQFNSMYDEIERLREALKNLLDTVCDPECGGEVDRKLAIKDARVALEQKMVAEKAL
jgi:glycine cleavage system regulatory protein